MLQGEIISIGNELLQGRMDDTNATYISRIMNERGVKVRYRTTVADTREDIVDALQRAASRADIVTATGGLGPTVDDLTAAAVADFLGVDMFRDDAVDAHVRTFHEMLGVPCTDNALEQALVPDGCHVIMNPVGTAPCFVVRADRARMAFFPGVPREMTAMLGASMDYMLQGLAHGVSATRTLRLFGIGESTLQPLLPMDIITSRNPSFSFLPVDYQIHLRLTARADSEEQSTAMLDATAARIYEIVGEYIYGQDETTLEQAVFDRLRAAGLTLALAESITGGLVASRLVSVPGMSQVLLGSVTAYSEAAKMKYLNVSEELLARYGPVSEQVTIAMARGALDTLGADMALATTGNAGPEAQGKAEVGQVYAALVFRDPAREPVTFSRRIFRRREDCRGLTAQFAIDMLRRFA
jgi:nicotinamide-nucleotide amidase